MMPCNDSEPITSREVLACVGHGVHPQAALEFIAEDYNLPVERPQYAREQTILNTRQALDSDNSWGGRIRRRLEAGNAALPGEQANG